MKPQIKSNSAYSKVLKAMDKREWLSHEIARRANLLPDTTERTLKELHGFGLVERGLIFEAKRRHTTWKATNEQ